MKKLISLVLALAMVLMVGAALAAKIDVQNVIDGETYTAYKILNYTSSGDAYSYYLSADEYASIGSILIAAGFEFEASSDGSQYTLTNADDFSEDNIGAVAAALKTANLGDALGKYTAEGANGEASFENLPVGYYFVTSSAGTLCALHSETDIATAVEKNTIPEEEKKQCATENGEYTTETLDFNIGDTVYYQVEITDGTGTDSAITLTDTMTAGLTYQNDAKVYVGDTEVTAGDDTFALTNNADGFKIVFADAYIAGLDTGAKIVVKYSAVINADATIDSDTNTNTAKLEYSKQEQTKTVALETYDFVVKKTDGTNFLDGAEFKLYDAANDGNQILLKKDDTGYYKADDGDATLTIVVDSEAGCNVRGLAPGTYYLEEVVVPDGYNKLAAREAVTITTGATAAVEVTVVNNAGTELPSTGGIGTTIFYVVGGILLIGAAIVLVARRKASN